MREVRRRVSPTLPCVTSLLPAPPPFLTPSTQPPFTARRSPEQIEGKKIADLGTGTGLTGLVALHLGAREVTFTDVGPVLELTRENLSSNCTDILASKASVSEYWWGSGTLGKHCYDMILVADCILPKLYPIEPLVAAIDELLVQGNAGACFVR